MTTTGWDRNTTRSKVRSMRAPTREWDRWENEAEQEGVTVNAWLRTHLNRQCDLKDAMRAMETTEREKGLLVDRTPGEET